jgi:hypothetical protein
VGATNPSFVHPYRPETLPVLAWAAENSQDWVWSYLLALNLWAVDRRGEAADLLEALGETPDFGPFYAARGLLDQELRGADPEPDLERAVALEPGSRILQINRIRHLQEAGRWEEAWRAVGETGVQFPTDFNVALLHAKAAIHVGRPDAAADILDALHVLPSENARESHLLWAQAHTLSALDAYEAGGFETAREHLMAALEWPERLGQGRPYQPEERLVRFILGRAEERLGNEAEARAAYEAVVDATEDLRGAGGAGSRLTRLDLLAISALEALGRSGEVEEINRASGSEFQALSARLNDDLEGRMILRALSSGGGQK